MVHAVHTMEGTMKCWVRVCVVKKEVQWVDVAVDAMDGEQGMHDVVYVMYAWVEVEHAWRVVRWWPPHHSHEGSRCDSKGG